jgi:predicted SprT family Zn-dependent metalloprotease
MELKKAQVLAENLIQDHGLVDWEFRFDRAKKRFGLCHYTDRYISLSRYLTELNPESLVRETILHEIAHALCSPGEGHGKRWRETVTAIGGNPKRCYHPEEVKTPKLKYTGHCPHCAKKFSAQRKRKVACLSCCQKHNYGRFSKSFLIEFSEN